MNTRTRTLISLALLVSCLGTTAHAQPDDGLAAVQTLSTVNGQALACQAFKAAARAKNLMLAHAPRTAKFADAYENGTQQAFGAQVNAMATCPDEAALSSQLDVLALRLQAALPATEHPPIQPNRPN